MADELDAGQLGAALALIVTNLVVLIRTTPEGPDQTLEQLAGLLLSDAQVAPPGAASLLRAVARTLMASEAPGGPDDLR